MKAIAYQGGHHARVAAVGGQSSQQGGRQALQIKWEDNGCFLDLKVPVIEIIETVCGLPGLLLCLTEFMWPPTQIGVCMKGPSHVAIACSW